MRKKHELKYKLIERAFILITVWILSIGVYLLARQITQYIVSRDTFQELREEVILDEDDFDVDWNKLKDYDVIGWIRFPYIEEINYPIVQGETNDDYLRKLYNGESNVSGSIFANCKNSADFSDANTLIYGHNMADGTMFNKLKNFEDKEYWYKNNFFYIYMPDGTRHTYKIFSVADVIDGTEPYTMNFTSKESYSEFIRHMIENSIYETDVKEANAEHRIVTLSTCTPHNSGSGYRKIVQAVEVEVVRGKTK